MSAAGPSQGVKAPSGGSETGAAVHRGGFMSIIDRLLRLVSCLTGTIALGFLCFMMVGTTVDALARTLAGKPLPGLFEMSELCMVMMVFMGLGWTQLDDAHIRVTLAKRWLPAALGRALDGVAWLLASVMLAALAWPSTLEAIESVAIREFRWGYVEVPIWWVKVAVAFGLWFGAVHMLCCALRASCRPGSASPTPTDPQAVTALH